MTRIPGVTLRDAWEIMDEFRRESVIADLKHCVSELRSLCQEDPGWIGLCSRGPAFDHRVNDGKFFGPLK